MFCALYLNAKNAVTLKLPQSDCGTDLHPEAEEVKGTESLYEDFECQSHDLDFLFLN